LLTDEVELESIGNTAAIVRSLKPGVAQVVIANPLRVQVIGRARIKTDKIDAAVLAQLHASGFLPTVWMRPIRILKLCVERSPAGRSLCGSAPD
jgi:hypothetical protein